MTFFRLLAIILAVFYTWLLNSAQSDHIQKYKRTLAQRADRALAGEQCGSISRKRPPRSTAQQFPLVGVVEKYASLIDLHLRKTKTTRSCSGECGSSDTNAVELTNWDSNENGKYYELQKETFISKKEGKQSEEATAPGFTKSHRPLKSISKGHPIQTELGGDLIDSLSSPSRVARSLPDFNKEEDAPNDTQDTNIHHIDYSKDSDEYSGEQEGLQSSTGELWRANVQDVPAKWMTAVYFRGQAEQLKVNPAFGIELPRSRFTLELWVKPEGGQNNPAIIAGGCGFIHHSHYLKSLFMLKAGMQLFFFVCVCVGRGGWGVLKFVFLVIGIVIGYY